jgi:hypothetical protein
MSPVQIPHQLSGEMVGNLVHDVNPRENADARHIADTHRYQSIDPIGIDAHPSAGASYARLAGKP